MHVAHTVPVADLAEGETWRCVVVHPDGDVEDSRSDWQWRESMRRRVWVSNAGDCYVGCYEVALRAAVRAFEVAVDCRLPCPPLPYSGTLAECARVLAGGAA